MSYKNLIRILIALWLLVIGGLYLLAENHYGKFTKDFLYGFVLYPGYVIVDLIILIGALSSSQVKWIYAITFVIFTFAICLCIAVRLVTTDEFSSTLIFMCNIVFSVTTLGLTFFVKE